MKKPLRFMLTAAISIFPLGVDAAMWSTVISSEKMRVEIDLASYQRQGGIVTAWDRELYAVLEQARPGDFYFKSAKSLMRYNCSTRTADLLMKIYYAEDGGEITTVTASYYGKPNYVIPDTDGEKKFEHVCQYKKPEAKKPVAIVKKKSEKPKEADKSAAVKSKEASPGDKAKAPMPAAPAKPPPRSLPILKPSGTPAKPAAEAGKG